MAFKTLVSTGDGHADAHRLLQSVERLVFCSLFKIIGVKFAAIIAALADQRQEMTS